MLNGNGKLGWYWKLKCLSENGKFLDAGETHTEYNLQAENLNNKLPHDTQYMWSRQQGNSEEDHSIIGHRPNLYL